MRFFINVTEIIFERLKKDLKWAYLTYFHKNIYLLSEEKKIDCHKFQVLRIYGEGEKFISFHRGIKSSFLFRFPGGGGYLGKKRCGDVPLVRVLFLPFSPPRPLVLTSYVRRVAKTPK